MPAAASLKDLLRIRHANRRYIESLNGNLGSALGFKRRTGQEVSDEPAILIFVPRKIEPRWLDDEQLIRKELKGPGGLTCPTDVVEGGKDEDLQVWANDGYEDFLASATELRAPVGLDPGKLRLLEQLRGWTKKVMPGCQLAAFDEAGDSYHGTLGCFARRKTDGALGFLTNHHVSGKVGTSLFFPETHGRPIGITARCRDWVEDQTRFPGLVDERKARYVLDAAFVELSAEIDDSEIEPRLPVLEGGEVVLEELGEPLPLDLDTMGPLGREVVGVGRTRSFQRGTIAAFAYECEDEEGTSTYTDYLVIGEDDDEFSDPGDSGKLIVTRDGYRPVALLWGGWREQLRAGRAQENWTYAIDVDLVLDALGIEILRTL